MNFNLKSWYSGPSHSLHLTITPFITGEETIYALAIPKGYWPIYFFTATTDMKDCIGNITDIKNKLCAAKAVYRGAEIILHGIRVLDDTIKSVGERVMITEHLNVEGKLELIATKKRMLQDDSSDLNFVNFGYSNEKESHYMRVDIYTGETNMITGPPNRIRFEG